MDFHEDSGTSPEKQQLEKGIVDQLRRAVRTDLLISAAIFVGVAGVVGWLSTKQFHHIHLLDQIGKQQRLAAQLHSEIQDVSSTPTVFLPGNFPALQLHMRQRTQSILQALAHSETGAVGGGGVLFPNVRPAAEKYFGAAEAYMDLMGSSTLPQETARADREMERSRINLLNSSALWQSTLNSEQDKVMQGLHTVDRYGFMIPLSLVIVALSLKVIMNKTLIEPRVRAFQARQEEKERDLRASERFSTAFSKAHHSAVDLVGRLDSAEVSKRLLHIVRESISCDGALLVQFDNASGATHLLNSFGTFSDPAPILRDIDLRKDTLIGRALNGKTTVLRDVRAGGEESVLVGGLLTENAQGTVAVVPLVGQGPEVLGAIVAVERGNKGWTLADLEVLEVCASYAAIALRNSQTYELQADALARMKETDRLKTEFIAGLSHELKTPLAIIKGSTEFLLSGGEGAVTDGQRRFLSVMKRNANLLDGFVSNLLDLSRIEAGQFHIQLSDCEARPLISEVMEFFSEYAKEKNLTMESLPADGRESEDVILMDRDRMKQVILNLCSNAIRFTPAGGRVEVGVQCEPTAARFIVRDTGIGIPPQDQPRIFEKFFQASNVQGAQRREGTGLGLAISKAIVEAHHGSIEVVSEPGKGTSFTVTIPRSGAWLMHEVGAHA